MGFIFWLAFLLIGFPAILALIVAFYNPQDASEGKKEIKWGYTFLIISVVLLILIFVDFSKGIFVSMKHFSLLFTKIGIAITLLLLSINTFTGISRRNKWTERINSVLQGNLGKELKRYLPSDSMRFWVYSDYISFLDNNVERKLYFSTLGYKEIPAIYADVVCRWIAKNVLKNYDSYIIVRMYIEHERWEGGTSDYLQIDKTYSGYEARTVSGDAGHQVKTKETLGYTLMHSSLYGNDTARKSLKSW